jgi:hypothetical protein
MFLWDGKIMQQALLQAFVLYSAVFGCIYYSVSRVHYTASSTQNKAKAYFIFLR